MKKILIISICLFLISKSAFGASLLINEIHPNPNGADKDREWIEIINLGSTNLNLENHQALLNNKTIYAFENTILPPNTPLAITTPPLKNSGGHIVLKNDQNQTIDQITY